MDSINNIVKKLREGRILQEKENYNNYSDNELISRAQDGDQLAFETLMNNHKDLIGKMANTKFTQDNDYEDMYQIASMGFWDAVQKYDPDRSGDFEAYAGMIIKRKLTDELRKEDTDRRRANANTTSLDATMDTSDDSDYKDGMTKGENTGLVDKSRQSGLGQDPADLAIGNMRAKELLKYMKEKLSATEREAVMMYIKGYKISEIAEETGMKYKSVENALMRVKNKVADYLRTRESKKIRESKGIEFSDEEKKIVESVLIRISEEEKAATSDSEFIKWNRKYEDYTEDQLDAELDKLESEFERIDSELRDTDYDHRESIAEELEDLISRYSAMEEYLTDEQYERYEKMHIPDAEDTPYDGDEEPHHRNPYDDIGMKQSDFI